MNFKSKIITAFVLLANIVIVQAQVQDQSQDIIKNFDARLIETEKVKVAPLSPAVDTATKAQGYTVPNKVVNIEYQTPKMRPIAIPQQKAGTQYNGYVKGGYGFPSSPYAEAAYRYGNANKYLIGAKIKHHSADNSKVLDNQRFSYTGGELNGSFYTSMGMAVDAKLGFVNDARYYYGYNHSRDTFTKAAAKQAFNTFSGGAKIYNAVRTNADLNYGLGINFYNLSDNFSANEFGIDAKLEATKWFSEKHPLSMIIRYDHTGYDSVAVGGKTQAINNIYLNPSFTYKGGSFSVRLGANLVSADDVFHPLPDIEASANIAGNSLAIFAGWKGDMVKNSYRNITNYNPFVYYRLRFSDTLQRTVRNTEKMEYFGGVKGGFSFLEYSLQIGYSNNNNLALYLADTTDRRRRFVVLYDTVGITNFRGAVTMKPAKNFEVVSTLSQNIYNTKKQPRAWGLPSLDLNVGAKYTVQIDPKKETQAIIKAGLFVQNGVNYINAQKQADRLNPLYDFSLGGEMWFSKNVGAFLDINNILNNKRERWYNHPTMGINILAGVTARF